MKKMGITYLIVLALTFFWWYNFVRPTEEYKQYICRDDDLASYTVKANRNNPDELARFYYKRTESCIALLKKNAEDKGLINKLEKCGILDTTNESVVAFVRLTLSDNNERAREELESVLKSIEPYSYCVQYDYVQKNLNGLKNRTTF